MLDSAAKRRAARKRLLELIRRQQNQVLALSEEQMKLMQPLLNQAEAELSAALRHWLETTADGDLRFTAQKYRVALLQTKVIQQRLEEGVNERLDESTSAAREMAIEHLMEQIAFFADTFEGSLSTIPLSAAKLIATGESVLMDRIRSSAHRYAGQVGKDLKQRLAVEILKGSSVHETVGKLAAEGGPRGLVALRGVLGEEGALVENIPEGLFRRYTWWAERLVRTETSSAYTTRQAQSRDSLAEYIPGLKKKWMIGPGACVVCQDIDGQVVGLDEEFQTSVGPIDEPPLHPCCACCCIAWTDRWSEYIS